MAQISATCAFPTWRDHWVSLEGVPTLLARADEALTRRAAGNQRIPHRSSSTGSQILEAAVGAMRTWSGGVPPKDVSERPDIVRRIHSIIEPVLPAAVWPRWLFLERAFLDASNTGDLLFAAVTLRTMCEEVQRLHALDLDADRLAFLASSTGGPEGERLRLYFSVAWTAIGRLPAQMVLEGAGWPSLELMASAMPRLEKARRSLNSYVHPNYGSHIAALFPERAAAAQVLLQAVVAVYESFFMLSWAGRPGSASAQLLTVGPQEPWPQTVDRFQSVVLPECQRNAENPAVREVMKVPALTEWLAASPGDTTSIVNSEAVAPLLKGLPRNRSAEKPQSPLSEYTIWEGAREIDVVGLAIARHAERSLSEEFPSGAPDAINQVRWLRFNRHCLELAMLLDDVKAAAFKTQLIRQIAQRNGVAALLCVRSLIEHQALAAWLVTEVGLSLGALGSEAQAANPLPTAATALEQRLANFLIAQAKGSQESRRSWVVDQDGAVRTAWLNLTKVVEAAFPDSDRFRSIYALASAVMHGRTDRGIDLIAENGDGPRRACELALLVLERICSEEGQVNRVGEVMRLSLQLAHAEAFGGTGAAKNDRMARQAFGAASEPLLAEHDYHGEGTIESPFRLAPHLEFYQGCYSLLRQLGVDISSCKRELRQGLDSEFCDRWRAPDRDYWFAIESVVAPFASATGDGSKER